MYRSLVTFERYYIMMVVGKKQFKQIKLAVSRNLVSLGVLVCEGGRYTGVLLFTRKTIATKKHSMG